MLLDDYINKHFNIEIEKNKKEIIDYLETHREKVSIILEELEDEEYDDILKNGLTDDYKLIEIIDDELIIRRINQNITNIIDNYLSCNVKELDVPKKIFEKLRIMHYKRLKKVNLTGEELLINKEWMDLLSKITNIKKISGEEIEFSEDLKENSVFYSDSNLLYNNIIIEIDDDKPDFIYSNDPFSSLDKILDYTDLESSTFIIDYKIEYEFYFKFAFFSDFNNIGEIVNAINILEKRGLEINNILINLDNKDYDDIKIIKQLQKKYSVYLEYRDTTQISYDDFISMRETLNYYKELILGADLSPLERVLYAYDIIKSFKYREEDEYEDEDQSRLIHNIIRDGKIVCVGYSLFLEQLLSEVGIKCICIDSMDETHQRNLVNVTDDEYDIEGTYALDVTWDSDPDYYFIESDDGKCYIKTPGIIDEDYNVIKRVDGISFYNYFMIPASKYDEVFNENGDYINPYLKCNIDIIESYNTVSGIDEYTFIQLLYNVRRKEGYTYEEAIDSINETFLVRNSINNATIDDEELENDRTYSYTL